jgi:hypothetical protein
LICHARVNVLFYCDKHPLHLRICLLPPLALTPFWVLFTPILQRGPNGEGQTQKHLLLARRRRFKLIFYYTPRLYVQMQDLAIFLYTRFNFLYWCWSRIRLAEIPCKLILQLAPASDGIVG